MLWYKGWLETRIKLMPSVAVVLLLLSKLHAVPSSGMTPAVLGAVLAGNILVVMPVCLLMAGAGIVTQPALQAVKGIHGSTLFTLSLPVSRLRLLAVRAGLGWLLLAGMIAMLCLGLPVVSPALRAMATPADLFEYGATLLAGGSLFYFFSVLLATFLEDMWRVWLGMLSFMGLWWLSKNVKLPIFADIFRAMGKGSPLLTHSLPWSTVGFSVGWSVVLLFAALKIVRVREY